MGEETTQVIVDDFTKFGSSDWEKMLKESKAERFKIIHAHREREEAKKVFWNKLAWTLMVMASIYVASLLIAALI